MVTNYTKAMPCLQNQYFVVLGEGVGRNDGTPDFGLALGMMTFTGTPGIQEISEGALESI